MKGASQPSPIKATVPIKTEISLTLNNLVIKLTAYLLYFSSNSTFE